MEQTPHALRSRNPGELFCLNGLFSRSIFLPIFTSKPPLILPDNHHQHGCQRSMG